MDEELTVGEVARRAGIRTSAIRYYERVGLLPAPPRVSRHRRYDPSVVQRLAVLYLAQEAGFTSRYCSTGSRPAHRRRNAGKHWRGASSMRSMCSSSVHSA